MQSLTPNGIRSIHPKTMGNALAAATQNPAIVHLLELGAIHTTYPRLTVENVETLLKGSLEEVLSYHATDFGRAIAGHIYDTMGMHAPEIAEILRERSLPAQMADNRAPST
jgi:hypothetical protein